MGKSTKFKPRYGGPFQVLSKVGSVAYQLSLPTSLKVHNLFHVSLLKNYVHGITHVIDWSVIQVEPEGDFRVEPLFILNKKETMLQNQDIA